MTNKDLFKGLIIFGAGMGAGYLLTKQLLTKQYQEDVAEVKDFYMNKLTELGVMSSDFKPEELIVEEDDEEYQQQIKTYNTVSAEHSINSKGRPITKYNKPPLGQFREYNEPITPDDEMTDEEVLEMELEARADEYARRKHENRNQDGPYIIDEDEYQNGPDEYDRQVLYYYSRDRVLCEDDDSMVEDEEELVGLDYEDVLDMQTNVWVRNDAINTLYHIHRIDESYHDTVADVLETPLERDYRIKGRRKGAIDS